MKKKPGPCDCPRCRELCLGNPGWFLPGQASRAAAHLGLTLETFFDRYLILEYLEGPFTETLSPRRFGQKRSEAYWGDIFLMGRCLLLGDSGCLLPPDLRPAECLSAFGCRPRRPGEKWRLPVAQPAWADHQEEIVQIRRHLKEKHDVAEHPSERQAGDRPAR